MQVGKDGRRERWGSGLAFGFGGMSSKEGGRGRGRGLRGADRRPPSKRRESDR